ncbi:MAG TPA: tRNA pseudouridine(55) synthase TruB [Geobacteraceae bacterium]
MDGFIVVDKRAGMTSHDVVSAVRRIAGLRKVGHTGTLDPFATGVLPVALGEGTKAIPFLDESVKEYRAVMRLGAATDTQDCTGMTTRQGEWRNIAPAAVTAVVRGFLGRGTQVPPMYSALKRNGVPLYKLARKGEEVPREPREIEIYSLEIERIDLPDVAFVVRCSRGVYVRTLANDMGERLGCGAHLVGLRRTMSGPFAIEQAVLLEKLASDAGEGRLAEHLISCYAALAHLPPLSLTEPGEARVVRGISPEASDFQAIPVEGVMPGERVRLSRGGRLLAVAENGPAPWPGEGKNLRLLRVFNEH